MALAGDDTTLVRLLVVAVITERKQFVTSRVGELGQSSADATRNAPCARGLSAQRRDAHNDCKERAGEFLARSRQQVGRVREERLAVLIGDGPHDGFRPRMTRRLKENLQ